MVRANLAWHRQHRNIIKSSLLMDDHDILEAISNAFSPINLKFSLLLQHHSPRLKKAAAIAAAARILRLMMAVFHQVAIFGDISSTGHDLTDDDLVRVLVISALALLSPPPRNRRKAAPS